MKKTKKYHLYKRKTKERKVELNSKNEIGYIIKPKNQMKYEGIVVNSMSIINNELIQTLLKKKIKKKLDMYLQFLITVLDEDDTDAGHLMFALNDLERYRRLVINNYKKYLDQKYLKLLKNKMDLIEQELKSKIKIDINNFTFEEMEIEEPKKGRNR
jgi:hypothetical protein